MNIALPQAPKMLAMDSDDEMRAFWDQKAAANPLWYVHSGLDFQTPDEAEFFASGEREVAAALQAAGITGGALAVDIGVGAARLTRPLADRFERVWACDVSPAMLEVARRNLEGRSNVELATVSGDGTIPLGDGIADFVLSLQVLQHIPARAASLRYVAEAGRVLRPGGAAVFHLRSCLRTDPMLGSLELGVRALIERLRRWRTRPPPELDSPAWRGARVGLWHLRAAGAPEGLRIVRHRWISRRGASLLVVCRKHGGIGQG